MSDIYYDQLARHLKRYWMSDIQTGASGIASVSNSGWQAWTISHLAAADPHPQYLLQAEADALYVPLSRTLTAGNLMQTIGTLGVDRTIAVDSSKLTVTAGKLDKTGAGTLTLNAASSVTLTIPSTGTLDLGGGSFLGSGFTVQAPASGTLALGAATLSFSSINNVSTSTHSHAVTGTQSGASNTFVATTSNGDIVAGRDLTAVRYVGGGIASPTNALHGRDASGSQLRLDDGTNYAVFSVGGAGDLSLSLISSTRFVKYNNFSSTAAFTSGFSGSGWRVDYGQTRSGYASLEVDDLVVRGRMRVYELLIHQIRFGTGSYLFTPGMKAVTVTGSGPYTLVGDPETPHGLAVDDLMRAQRFTGTGTYQSNVRVTTVTNAYTVVVTLSSGDAPAAGMEFARVGNFTDATRRGSVYITSDDSGGPFIDVNDGVATFSDFGSAAKNKVRIGNLTGYTDPFWGTLTGYGIATSNGYFRNVKINGSAIIGSGVGLGLAAALYIKGDTAPNSFVPNTNGHLGQKPFTVGGVAGLPLGPFAGVGAIAIAEGTTNLHGNPRFANSTFNTGFTVGSNTTITATTDALFGSTAAQLAFTGTGNRFMSGAVVRTSTANPLSVGVWVKSLVGIAQVAIGIWNAGLTSSTVGPTVQVGDQWTYLTHTALAAALPSPTFGTTVNVLVYNDYDNGTAKTIVVGAIQSEEKAFSTPIAVGDMGSGFSWTGTPHQSTTIRAAAGMVFAPSGNLPTVTGSAGGWFWAGAGNSGANTGNRVIFHTDTGPFLVLRVNASNLLEGYWGSATINGGTVTARTWNHGLITSDGTTVRLYLNGVQVASGSYSGPIGNNNLQVGSYQGTQQWINGYVADLFVTDRTLTSDEAKMIANANTPLAITRSNFELVLSEPGFGRIVGNAGGLYATDQDGVNSFMLLNSTQGWNGESLPAGSMLLGDNNATTGGANLLYNPTFGGLYLRNKQTTVISFLSTANSAGQIATFDGVIGITSSGGIWQGSAGTFASPTTGFKLYTSSSKAIWEAWNAGAKQVYIDPSDMSLRAGAGAVVLSSTGMTLTGGTSSVNQIKWLASGNLIGYSYTSVVSSVNTMALLTSNLNGFGGLISLNAQASGGAFTTLEVDSINGRITASKSVFISSGGIRTVDFGNIEWKLGGYTGGAPAATGYVQVNINGTTYKLLTST